MIYKHKTDTTKTFVIIDEGMKIQITHYLPYGNKINLNFQLPPNNVKSDEYTNLFIAHLTIMLKNNFDGLLKHVYFPTSIELPKEWQQLDCYTMELIEKIHSKNGLDISITNNNQQKIAIIKCILDVWDDGIILQFARCNSNNWETLDGMPLEFRNYRYRAKPN